MTDAADLAFRQAFALCRYSPEAVCRYANFLLTQGRQEDAISVLETGLRQAASRDGSASDDMAKMVAELKAQKGVQ